MATESGVPAARSSPLPKREKKKRRGRHPRDLFLFSCRFRVVINASREAMLSQPQVSNRVLQRGVCFDTCSCQQKMTPARDCEKPENPVQFEHDSRHLQRTQIFPSMQAVDGTHAEAFKDNPVPGPNEDGFRCCANGCVWRSRTLYRAYLRRQNI